MTLNLRKWRDVMDTYLAGGFSYHTTMPTDCLALFRDAAQETEAYGFEKAKEVRSSPSSLLLPCFSSFSRDLLDSTDR